MDEQLFAVVAKRRVEGKTKSGKAKISWEKIYRAPTAEDDNSKEILERLAERSEHWAAMNIIPTESIGILHPKWDIKIWGVMKWSDMFSSRQLLSHGYNIQIFQEMLEEDRQAGRLSATRESAYIYLALAIDKMLDYNARLSYWDINVQSVRHVFGRHDFSFVWSFAEMDALADGLGLEWALKATGKALQELIAMVAPEKQGDMLDALSGTTNTVAITNGSAAAMNSIADRSIEVIVMDPPYGANVQYAMLSDFFYVWLKRTAGLIMPQLFTRNSTEKDDEAVANAARFKGQGSPAEVLAVEDYRQKMATIFIECKRVLRADGIMTVMFTHKDTGAWDALTSSLMEAGFTISASWPINTESGGGLHIKGKAAANSTIFLVCRPRDEAPAETVYWEDIEPEVARAVRARVGEYQAAGIAGVDLYLASFGPALEAFSRHWPLTRGTPAPEPKRKRRTQADMFEEFDPYAVRPEDALNAARREVKAWRLAQLASAKAEADMDAPTAFYVLAWDAFKAVSFPYDEALRLSRAVGVDLEEQVVGRLAEKKGSEIKLWDSATRIAKGAIGPADGARGMIDALHHVAHTVRVRGVEAAVEQLDKAGIAQDDEFKVALEALLEVLPPSKTYSGIDADKAIKPAADDFDALETLRRIAYENEIGEPQQLELYREMMAAE